MCVKITHKKCTPQKKVCKGMFFHLAMSCIWTIILDYIHMYKCSSFFAESKICSSFDIAIRKMRSHIMFLTL